MLPSGDLEIVREYSCGCIVYRDESGIDWTELGLFCEPDKHKASRVKGEPDQVVLF